MANPYYTSFEEVLNHVLSVKPTLYIMEGKLNELCGLESEERKLVVEARGLLHKLTEKLYSYDDMDERWYPPCLTDWE
jgi:hypothetical protein